ncbi:ComEC/Rec2 family competence protein [Halalkalibacter urbisdiaboli]|uniref:ComEC/Rec2 family competence protein n=1 Tax=Halalkalibacter urbisdiaboli TaxID=1960589 RepID=UPI000B452A31|nr:hypothetical protein [Halalkalibacter urbisdiaboli]
MRMIQIGFVCFFLMPFLLAFELELKQVEKSEVDIHLHEKEIAFMFLDLPSGEATLIKAPDEQAVLIGTGASDSKQALIKRLEKFHVHEIEAVILPRFEDEYAGNTKFLIDNYHVDRIIVPEKGMEIAKAQFKKEKLTISSWEEGSTHELLPSLQFQALPSIQTLMPKLSMSITFAKHHFLFATEANEALEKTWLESKLKKVNVLKVPEFGVKKDISQQFLDEIDPQVAIMFAKENSVPHSQVIERMQETWIDTYQTKQNGTILIKADQQDYQLLTVQF